MGPAGGLLAPTGRHQDASDLSRVPRIPGEPVVLTPRLFRTFPHFKLHRRRRAQKFRVSSSSSNSPLLVWDALDRQDWRRKRIAKDSKHFHAYARPVTDGSYSRDTHPTYGNSMYGTKWVGTEDDVRKYLEEHDPKLLKRNSLLRWVPGKVTSFSPAYKT